LRAYKLTVGGLVENPLELSLAQLRAMPSRTQITRHDCVEGWSCIGKWKGTPLGARARPGPADAAGALRRLSLLRLDGGQTLDGRDYALLREHRPRRGASTRRRSSPTTSTTSRCRSSTVAPIRCRVERQLGYKQAKYVKAIELVASFAPIRGGKGGYWEDEGYEWYGGI
jgi:DMSO/TMAO reductase YedYZ molybdopterin-dependent catalytic subunit